MGMNLFVEGFPAPFLIQVRLPRSVASFAQLREVTTALSSIDKFLSRSWHKEWSSFVVPRRQRNVFLVSFRLTTPPVFQILTDPAWLAILLLILVGYKDLKASTREMHKDIGAAFSKIKGLSERQSELLSIAVTMSIDKSLQKAERDSIKLAKQFRKIRQALVGDAEELPDIIVIDIDSHRPW